MECDGLTGVENRDTNVLHGLGDASFWIVPERVDEEKASEASSLAIWHGDLSDYKSNWKCSGFMFIFGGLLRWNPDVYFFLCVSRIEVSFRTLSTCGNTSPLVDHGVNCNIESLSE